MNFRQLHYFTEVVRQGSMKRAAECLYISQPSISRQIQTMEEELGVQLLNRTARGVVPTEAGQLLFTQAQSILSQLAELQVKVRSESLEPSGPVILGLPSTLSSVLSVPLVERVLAKTPKVSLRIVESMSGYIRDWLYAGKLDIGILYRAERSTGLILEPFISENLYLVTLPGSQDKIFREIGPGLKEVSLKDITGKNMILPARPHGLRELVDKAIKDNDLQINVAVELDALELIKSLVSRGHGYSILPHAAVYKEVARGELCAARIVDPELTRTAYLASLSERALPYSALAVKKIMQECALEISSGSRWTCNFDK